MQCWSPVPGKGLLRNVHGPNPTDTGPRRQGEAQKVRVGEVRAHVIRCMLPHVRAEGTRMELCLSLEKDREEWG